MAEKHISASTEILVPAKMTAIAAGVGVETVMKVRAGKRGTGPKARKAATAERLLQEGIGKLIADIQTQVSGL